MKIETDKYLINTSKDFQVQIKSKVEDSPTLRDKTKVGTVGLSSPTYYPTLKAAYIGLSKRLMLESDDIKSFEDIFALHEELLSDVKSLESKFNVKE